VQVGARQAGCVAGSRVAGGVPCTQQRVCVCCRLTWGRQVEVAVLKAVQGVGSGATVPLMLKPRDTV
jgi:hypothetical protein